MSTGLEAIFLANRDALLRFLKARGASEPEDLVQEVWFRCISAPAGPISDPLSYLYRMANNLMLDRARSKLRRERRDLLWMQDAPAVSNEASDEPSHERVLLAREQLRAAEQVLAGLGERTETIFRRFRLDGVAQAEIASELGISLSAVEKHLQRAYRALLAFRAESDAE